MNGLKDTARKASGITLQRHQELLKKIRAMRGTIVQTVGRVGVRGLRWALLLGAVGLGVAELFVMTDLVMLLTRRVWLYGDGMMLTEREYRRIMEIVVKLVAAYYTMRHQHTKLREKDATVRTY